VEQQYNYLHKQEGITESPTLNAGAGRYSFSKLLLNQAKIDSGGGKPITRLKPN